MRLSERPSEGLRRLQHLGRRRTHQRPPPRLRGYEAKGLLDPHRTDGGTRRYSADDLERIRRITTLLAAGLNLTGIRRVLELEDETADLRGQLDQAQDTES